MSGFFKDAGRILTSQDAPCGCLVILAATNVSAEGQDVNDALRALRKEGRDWFLARLRRAVEDRQLPAKTDVEALASALNTMLEGMSLQARDGVTHDELDRVAAIAMAMLPGTQKSERAHRPKAGRSRSVRQRKSTSSRQTKRYG